MGRAATWHTCALAKVGPLGYFWMLCLDALLAFFFTSAASAASLGTALGFIV